MSVLQKTMPVSVNLRESISYVGSLALEQGTQQGREAAEICMGLALALGGEKSIGVKVPIDHLICQICDGLRAQGMTEELAKVEEVVKLIKGGQPRLVVATLGFDVEHVGQLDDNYEAIRRKLVR